jgi:predicted RNA binding protein YcfA (HicA-like mRNA interferase family)
VSLKPVSADKLIKILAKTGFKPIRQKGSHVILRHLDGRTTVIPKHPGEEVGRGLPMKILRDVGLTKEEYLKLIK